jgi:hypothetical protein
MKEDEKEDGVCFGWMNLKGRNHSEGLGLDRADMLNLILPAQYRDQLLSLFHTTLDLHRSMKYETFVSS